MLNFLDPVSIDNLTLFRDDEVPQKFYLLPDEPAIPLDPKGLPEFLFLLYLRDPTQVTAGQDDGAGYLQFRTVLTLDPARHDAVVAALRTQLTAEQAAGTTPFGNAITDVEPILADPLWTDGTVDLSTFQVSDTGLVRQATSKAPVDLTGDLGASFTLTLSEEGAGVFRGAFDAYRTGAHQLPLVITYNLTYAGRITATMHISAQHSVVHEQVWRHVRPWRLATDGSARYLPLQIAEPITLDVLPALRAKYGYFCPMIGIDDFPAAVQETIASNTITVDIKSAPTGDATADAATQASMMKLATDLITNSLMPSLTSGTPVPGSSDPTQQGTNVSLLQLDENATPGTSTFTLDLDDATSVSRPASPNAPLQVLIADPSTLSACFQELHLADGFFATRTVSVTTSGVDMSTSGIAKIHVFIQYNEVDELDMAKRPVTWQYDTLLDATTGSYTFPELSTARAADGSHKIAYQYMFEVYWSDGTNISTTKTTWATSTAEQLIITPPMIGAVRVDAVLTAATGVVDSATVKLTCTPTGAPTMTGEVDLTPAAPRGSWQQSTGQVLSPDQAASPSYQYQISYRTGDVTIAMPAQTSDQPTIEVPSPFSGGVTFTLIAQASADTVTAIEGTITYTDAAHGYSVVRELDVTPGGPQQDVAIPVMPGGPRTATCSGRVVNKDGTFTALAAVPLVEGVNFLGVQAVPPLVVHLQTDLIDFAADVKALHVALTFTHADGTTSTAEQIFTASGPGTFSWSVPRNPGDGNTYSATVTFYGFDRSKDQTVSLTGQSSTSVELDRSMAGS